MAEDGIIGFKFYDHDDNKGRDAAVSVISDNMFNEIAFDTGVDQLGAKGEDASSVKEAHNSELADHFESFDFTDGFEFIM